MAKVSLGGMSGNKLASGPDGWKAGSIVLPKIEDDVVKFSSGFKKTDFPLSAVTASLLASDRFILRCVDTSGEQQDFVFLSSKAADHVKAFEANGGKVVESDLAGEDLDNLLSYKDTGRTLADLEKADKKVAKLLVSNLLPGEEVSFFAKGLKDQTVALTDRHAFIVKTGWMAGQTMGGKATSFDYRQITGVEVRASMMTGIFEIRAAGLSTTEGSYFGTGKDDAYKAPNAIPISKSQVPAFQAAAKLIREKVDAALRPAEAAPVAVAAPEDIPAKLKQLADLRDAGILSPEEFETKKAELLARM